MRPMLTVNRRADNRLIRSASKLPAWIVPFEHHRRTARTRIRKTVAFARSVKEEQYAGASGRKIKFVGAPGKVIRGDDYLLQMIIPNTFSTSRWPTPFSATTASMSAKMDFLGPANLAEGRT